MSLRLRVALTALALGLVGGSVLIAGSDLSRQEPILTVFDPHFGRMDYGPLPLWLFLPPLAGLALLFAVWVVSKPSRIPFWAAVMLVVVWLLQVTWQAGIYGYEEESLGFAASFARTSMFSASTPGLVALLLAATAIAILDRLWPLAAAPPTSVFVE